MLYIKGSIPFVDWIAIAIKNQWYENYLEVKPSTIIYKIMLKPEQDFELGFMIHGKMYLMANESYL